MNIKISLHFRTRAFQPTFSFGPRHSFLQPNALLLEMDQHLSYRVPDSHRPGHFLSEHQAAQPRRLRPFLLPVSAAFPSRLKIQVEHIRFCVINQLPGCSEWFDVSLHCRRRREQGHGGHERSAPSEHRSRWHWLSMNHLRSAALPPSKNRESSKFRVVNEVSVL